MKIGIIGVGTVGGAIARKWAAAGHELLLGFSRDRSRLEAFARELGPRVGVGTPREVVEFGDVVLLAVKFWIVDDALAQAGDLAGKIVIDTSNPYRFGAD